MAELICNLAFGELGPDLAGTSENLLEGTRRGVWHQIINRLGLSSDEYIKGELLSSAA
jgi:hypothetical protein